MKNLDELSDAELLKYLKKRNAKRSNKELSKVTSMIISQTIEDKLEAFGLSVCCPECKSTSRIKHATTTKGIIRYRCKNCKATYTATTGTIFEGTDYTWDEMVVQVREALKFEPVEELTAEMFGHPKYTGALTNKGNHAKTNVKTMKIWEMRLKIYDALSKMPLPKLNGIIEVDGKYFRESQKGTHELVSFVSRKDLRLPRRHNYASVSGIFGSEFICVLAAVDRNMNYWAKCISLGTPSMDTVEKELNPYIESVQYICSDAYDVYEEWCDKHSYRHYVEPTQCRIERGGYGYIEVDNKHPLPLSEDEKAFNKKIAEKMYAERKWYHIRNSGEMDLDTMYLLKNKDNLNIETVNSFHSELEENLVKNKRSVSFKYLPLYIGAFTYRKNWQSEHGHTPTTSQDAQQILVEILKNGYHSTFDEIKLEADISSLPRPNKKQIIDARRKMAKLREVVVTGKQCNGDQSAYEGDDIYAPFLFDKRKFFASLGAIRLNDLAKQNGIFFKGQHKRDKINKLCALPNADEIIAYEVYLHSGLATEEEIKASKTKRPKSLYKKRGRPKKA